MTTQTQTFPAGAFSFTIPATLSGSTMQVTVVGGPGVGPLGGKGGRLTAVMPVTAGDVITGVVASGSAGAHAGGTGGGTGLYAGGGSTSLLRNGTKYAEVGGGGGATTYPGADGGNGGGNGTSSGQAGGSNPVGVGGTAGVSGGTAANGGNGSGGGGGGGAGAGPGGAGSGCFSGYGGGGGGGGASFAHSSLTSVLYFADGTSAFVSITFGVTTAPASPTLTYPIANSYVDPQNTAIPYTGIYNAVPGSGNLQKVTLRVSVDAGPYGYWDPAASNFSATSPVWFVPTTGAGVGAGGTFTVSVPAGKLSNNHTNAWSMDCQEATLGLQGAFANDVIYQATVIPTTAIISPAGNTDSVAPTVNWTATFSGSDVQVTAQIKTVSQAVHDAPGFSWGGVVSPIDDSGQVSTPYLTLSVSSSADINNGDELYTGLIVSQTGGAFSQWVETFWTAVLVGPNAPSLVAVGDNDGTTGAPISDLTAIQNDNQQTAADASFETGIGSWTCSGGTLSSSTDWAIDGLYSLKIHSTAGGTVVAQSGIGLVPVSPGQVITAMGTVHAAATARTVAYTLFWYQANGSPSSVTPSTTVQTASDSTSTNGVFFSGQGTAPSDAAFCTDGTSIASTATAELHYLDESAIFYGTVATWSPGGFLGAVTAQFQASYDGGNTWADVGAGTNYNLSSVPLANEQASGVDQWAPFGVPVQYRVRLASYVSGQLLTSDWSSVQTVTLPSTDWWLMVGVDPTTAMLALRAGSSSMGSAVYSMTLEENEEQGLFKAFGRDTYITVHGVMLQEEFDLPLYFLDQPSYDQFVAIRRLQTTVLIKSTDEGQRFYVSLGATRPSILANRPEPLRHRYITIHCSPVDSVAP
jgi:hypothetical protein